MTIHPLYRYWNLYAGMQKKHEIFKVRVTFVRIVFRITMKLNNSFVHVSHIFFFFFSFNDNETYISLRNDAIEIE